MLAFIFLALILVVALFFLIGAAAVIHEMVQGPPSSPKSVEKKAARDNGQLPVQLADSKRRRIAATVDQQPAAKA